MRLMVHLFPSISFPWTDCSLFRTPRKAEQTTASVRPLESYIQIDKDVVKCIFDKSYLGVQLD